MKKVLVVDDDILFLRSMQRILENESLDVKAVNNGEEAIRSILQNRYDMCFVDVCLPRLSGIEVVKKIVEVSPDTKVVVMTAGDITCEEARVIEEHAYHFLTKPFDMLQLKVILKNSHSPSEGVRS